MIRQSFILLFAAFAHEIRLLRRDRFCVGMLVLFMLLLAASGLNSYLKWREFGDNQVRLQAATREEWLSQPTVNAHMATHVGQTVYKPISSLTVFDPGAVPYCGSRLFLQSHQQSAATEPPQRDELNLLQNESYSPAVLLQQVGPLLIIILGHASIAREKEGGTLAMLLTTGTRWHFLVVGKCLAVLLAMTVVVAPALFLLAMLLADSGSLLESRDLMMREAAILIAVAIYYFGWLSLAIAVSSRCNSTIGGFSLLVAIWAILVLVTPRIAADAAGILSPLPTPAALRQAKENAVREANQSSVAKAKANKQLEARLLKQFGVQRVEDLPVDIAGARMIELEAKSNRIYDDLDVKASQIANRQDEIVELFQYASPYLAVRNVSASFSATDRAHHGDFLAEAESYRRQFVQEMNLAEMRKQKPGKSSSERREFWARVPDFSPQKITAATDLSRSWTSILCLIVWSALMGVFALVSHPRTPRTR